MPHGRRERSMASASRRAKTAPSDATASSSVRVKRRSRSSSCFWLLVAIIPGFVLLVTMLAMLLESPLDRNGARAQSLQQPTPEPQHLQTPVQTEASSRQGSQPLPLPELQPSRTNASLAKVDTAHHPVQKSSAIVRSATSHDTSPQRTIQPLDAIDTNEEASECVREAPSETLLETVRLDVTLVTQASAERLWTVPHICARWSGEMIVVTLSAALASTDSQPTEDGAIPATLNGTRTVAVSTAARCHLRRVRLMARPSDEEQGYPINRLRNAGIGCVMTSHYFVVDIDFWPSVELLPLLRAQLSTWPDESSPIALVVPNFQRSGHGCRNADDPSACRAAFEAGDIKLPTNFTSLRACLDSHDCVVFDGEYNPQGQASTDVRGWMRLPAGETRGVKCITSERYEPFVALRRTARTPLFDERFTGYGKNKVQLVVHLRRAGYAFRVLGGAFVIHFPHQRSASKHHWLHSGVHGRVDRLFSTFNHEMAGLYAGIVPRTPMCSDAHHTIKHRSMDGSLPGGRTGNESTPKASSNTGTHGLQGSGRRRRKAARAAAAAHDASNTKPPPERSTATSADAEETELLLPTIGSSHTHNS